MTVFVRTLLVTVGLIGVALPVKAANLTAHEFRRELVGVPLCGTPTTGAFAGKMLCSVHLPDGTAVVAGPGVLARGRWKLEHGHVCRRDANPKAPWRCIDYQKLGPDKYQNSDGIVLCIGPCPAPEPVAATPEPVKPAEPAKASDEGTPKDIMKPEAEKPAAKKPDDEKPAAAEETKPTDKPSDTPTADKPASEEPKSDEPKSTAPKPEDKTEAPKPDDKAEAPKPGEPLAGAKDSDEPKPEAPKPQE